MASHPMAFIRAMAARWVALPAVELATLSVPGALRQAAAKSPSVFQGASYLTANGMG